MAMSREQMEKRWGVRIISEPYWSPFRRKFRNDYIIYSADGCCWDKGFNTLKEVEDMCRTDNDALLSIKKKVEETKRITAIRLAEQNS